MPPKIYPMCTKCNEGSLVPFFGPEGQNVYFCTNCGIKFTGYINEPMIDDQRIFRRKAIYLTKEDQKKLEKKAEMKRAEREAAEEEEKTDEADADADKPEEEAGR